MHAFVSHTLYSAVVDGKQHVSGLQTRGLEASLIGVNSAFQTCFCDFLVEKSMVVFEFNCERSLNVVLAVPLV